MGRFSGGPRGGQCVEGLHFLQGPVPTRKGAVTPHPSFRTPPACCFPGDSRSVFPGDSSGTSKLLGSWLKSAFAPASRLLPSSPRKSPAPQLSLEKSTRGPQVAELQGVGATSGDEAVLAAVPQSHWRWRTRGTPARVLSGSGSRPGPQGLRGPWPAGHSWGPGLPRAVLGRWRRVQDPLCGLGGRPREVLGQSCRADQLVQALDQNAREQTPFHQLVSDANPGLWPRRPLHRVPGVLLGKKSRLEMCAQIFQFVFNFNFTALLPSLEGFCYGS